MSPVLIETDPLREIDDRLSCWASWKKRQNIITEGLHGTILGRMIDEGFASLIHGQGLKREKEYPEEEETNAAIALMPRYLRRVVCINYLSWAPQEEKAKRLKMSHSMYRDYLRMGKVWLHGHLENKNNNKEL